MERQLRLRPLTRRAPRLLLAASAAALVAAGVATAVLAERDDGPVQRTGWDVTMAEFRGRDGLRVEVACPAGGAHGALWGTDLYTDDSSVCTAAVHTGRFAAKEGGTVTAVVRPGTASYAGTRRYGVESAGYGAWDGSFVLAP